MIQLAPIETFARLQLSAIVDSLMLAAGLLAGWLAGLAFHRFEWTLMVFRGSGVIML